ncbi:hypothetical protein BCR24_03355 [Enterococcus ureilyticus]|uniref:Uncharacterized protein n=1 Tax=Enterococcus ureilyticus TaxID=1131292 RepID=A0A1E5HC01_9ENTE|nr:hypothetical protein [Enterococcus ureilyticus]MBM7690303.1 hypothetical protein [Enterococcus ureilyticus]OEG22180.1 hypothetical protein BCR24_03355 [Enterococcus ureilyticus]
MLEKILDLQRNDRRLELISLMIGTTILDNWKFVFFSDSKGADLPENLMADFGTISVMSISGTSKFNYYDKIQAENLVKKSDSDFRFVTCINFDTQLISYMVDLFENKNIEKHRDVYLFLKHVLKYKMDYTCIPYSIENCSKLYNEKTKIGVWKTLRTFFFFKSMNNLKEFDKFFSSNEPLMINREIEYETQSFVEKTMKPLGKNLSTKDPRFMQKIIHCLILQVIIIKNSSKKGIKKKVELLFDFWFNQIGIFMYREIAICYLYLKNDKKVEKFFRKIQKNNENILGTISGMAWDLFHIRNLEKPMGSSENMDADFEMHLLATYDKGLKEILSSYPIKSISFYKSETMELRTYPFYKYSIEELITEIDLEQFSKKRSQKNRNKIYEKTNFDYVINERENVLKKLFEK